MSNHVTNDRYPRSAPFQAPAIPANSRPASTPRRATETGRNKLVLIAAATGLLILGVASGVLLMTRAGVAPSPTTSPSPTSDLTPRTPNDRMLETLGSLSATHLYQSYLNIGLLADAVESKAYTEEQATSMLATVVSLMNEVDKQLDKLAKMDLGKDEQQDVEGIRNLSVLLRGEVAALRTFWRTGEEQHAKRYHEAREKAWTALAETLGL